MSTPISGTVDTRPDRPDYPWKWFGEFITTDTNRIASVSGDPSQWQWSFCITSIHVSVSAVASYFELQHQHGTGETDTVVEVLVPPTSTVSLVFPTPLVIEAPTAWELYGVRSEGQLFSATLVGFWALNDLRSLSDSHVARSAVNELRPPRVPMTPRRSVQERPPTTARPEPPGT
jgi:hypothetical protein